MERDGDGCKNELEYGVGFGGWHGEEREELREKGWREARMAWGRR